MHKHIFVREHELHTAVNNAFVLGYKLETFYLAFNYKKNLVTKFTYFKLVKTID